MELATVFHGIFVATLRSSSCSLVSNLPVVLISPPLQGGKNPYANCFFSVLGS